MAKSSIVCSVRECKLAFVRLLKISGPGVKPADERTLEYLEEVAVETAK
jgi:hypothetical protein